jgi:DNA-binding winged helix-turn-helix (wHTH) protein/tetratricopeptide (TPR) repeat protein
VQRFLVAPRGWGGWTAGTHHLVRFLGQVITRPEPGPHAALKRPDGVQVLAPAYSGTKELPVVQGAWYESEWDHESGYHWFETQARIGTYHDRMLALQALTDATSFQFMGYDRATHPKQYALGFQDLYGDHLRHMVAELLADDVGRFAPALRSNGDLVYPDPLDPTASWPPLDARLVQPATYWLVQYDAMFFRLSLLDRGYDHTFLDRSRLFVARARGRDAAREPEAGVVRRPPRPQYPRGVVVPNDGALVLDANGAPIELGAGARMVEHALGLADRCANDALPTLLLEDVDASAACDRGPDGSPIGARRALADGVRRYGPFTLDPDRAELVRDGERVELQPKVFDLVALLSAEPGRIFTRQDLLHALWPGVRVTEASLHQAFRKARRALGDDPDAPRYLEAVARRGWRWIAPVEHAEGDGFVGRARELAELRARLVPGATVVLRGPGGAGKTALARRVAGDAALVIELGATQDPAEVTRRLAAALGISLETVDPALVRAALGQGLAARDGLVVFDGVDPGMAGHLSALRRFPCAAAWLLTSNGAVPADHVVPLEGLRGVEGRTLLRARAPTPLTDDEADAILGPIEGLPLLVELAAARLRLLSPAGLAGQLARSLEVLASGPVWATVATSMEALGPAELQVLEAAALVPRPFDPTELLGLVDLQPAEVLDALERLLDASLLQRAGDRLVPSNVVREFVTRTRSAPVARWTRRVAQRVEDRLDAAIAWDPDAFVALRAGLGDLVDALGRAGPDDRDSLAIGIGLACRYGGPWDLAWSVLSELRPRSPVAQVLAFEYSLRVGRPGDLELPDAPPAVAAWGRFLRARLRVGRGELEAALDDAEEARRLAETSENDALVAHALDVAATVHRARGDLGQVRTCYDRALGRLLHPAGRLARAMVALNYAASLAQAGLHEAALPRLETAAAALEPAAFPHLVAVARTNLAKALLQVGRVAEAEPVLRSALEGARRVGDLRTAAGLAEELSLVAAVLGRADEAESLLNEAQAAAPPDGGRRCSLALRWAWAAAARGDAPQAYARWESAAALATTDLQRAHLAMWEVGLARRLADPERAASALPRARLHATTDPDLARWVEAWADERDRPELPGSVPPDVWMVTGLR